MGAITTITLADAATTPVNHDFVPSKIDGDAAWFYEKSNDQAQGFYPLQLSLRRPQPGNGSKVFRAQLTLAVPVLVTDADGVDSVSHTNRVNIEFILAEKSSLQERKDLRAFTEGLVANSLVVDLIEGLNNVY
jgi:hypothetical protein